MFDRKLAAALLVAAAFGFSAPAQAEGGHVVAAVTGAKAARVQASQLLYRSRDGSVSGKLSFKTGESAGDLVAAAALPAGDYEVYDYFIRRRGRDGTEVLHLGGVALPFTVKPGETTYIGAFRASNLEGATGLFMLVADHSADNIAAARGLGIAGNINISLPDPKAYPHAVVGSP